MQEGFDNKLYKKLQAEKIKERIHSFDGKLYLEFGGKLFDDYHAARVLPGFGFDTKISLLKDLKHELEIIFCINANDIEKTKMRSDLGIPYDMEVLRLIDEIKRISITVAGVVITQYSGQSAADNFISKLDNRGVKNYKHFIIAGYPANPDVICSEIGYGKNEYIVTSKPLVVVTAPGPGSGKLAVCLSQIYHDNHKGTKSGYAKFETFPIWNLSLKHPVNVAYEAATADINDLNIIDPFHLEKYGEKAVNYNRDIEAFPIVNTILSKLTGVEEYYASPTEMGVNMAGFAITDDEVVQKAACQEIIARYYKATCEQKQGKLPIAAVERIQLLMQQLKIKPEDRPVVSAAIAKCEQTAVTACAIELQDGRVITGKASNLMTAASSCILNSIKVLSKIDDSFLLISPIILEPILKLKLNILGSRSSVLKLDDVLTALCISAATNPMAQHAVDSLKQLYGTDLHCTTMMHSGDEGTLRRLSIRSTCEPIYPNKDLFF